MNYEEISPISGKPDEKKPAPASQDVCRLLDRSRRRRKAKPNVDVALLVKALKEIQAAVEECERAVFDQISPLLFVGRALSWGPEMNNLTIYGAGEGGKDVKFSDALLATGEIIQPVAQALYRTGNKLDATESILRQMIEAHGGSCTGTDSPEGGSRG